MQEKLTFTAHVIGYNPGGLIMSLAGYGQAFMPLSCIARRGKGRAAMLDMKWTPEVCVLCVWLQREGKRVRVSKREGVFFLKVWGAAALLRAQTAAVRVCVCVCQSVGGEGVRESVS